MTSDLLLQLEQKVSHAVEVIELLRLQVEELDKENTVLKAEHEKWRRDLSALIKRLDLIDTESTKSTSMKIEEEFMTV
ncbi:MAG: cell division protein ZapB [Proteobacteria bacterium]|nr:cell division protein ZapB [Pseudomonadota bacterium]